MVSSSEPLSTTIISYVIPVVCARDAKHSAVKRTLFKVGMITETSGGIEIGPRLLPEPHRIQLACPYFTCFKGCDTFYKRGSLLKVWDAGMVDYTMLCPS